MMASIACSSARPMRQGLSVKRSPLYTHTYDHHHPILTFDDVAIPVADRIGEEGDGMGFTHAWFRRERLMIAARCCGAMARLIDEATDFAQDARGLGPADRRVSADPGHARRQRGRPPCGAAC